MLGLWAMEAGRFREFETQAREALRSGLVRPPHKEPSAAWDDEPTAPKVDKPPFRVLSGFAVIEIVGTMLKYDSSFSFLGCCSTVRIREAVRAAARDKTIRGILLKVDSPGGIVAGTSDLAEAVKAANQQKPVVTYVEDQMCSAALWAGSQARKVYANTVAVVGSVGTFACVYDTSGAYSEAGIKAYVIASAPLKGAGSDGQEITDEMLADWQREIGEMNERFVSGFAKGRRMPLDKARELADGRSHVGTNAQALGFIDGVMSFDAAFKELQKMATQDKDTLDIAQEAEERAIKAEQALAETQAALATVQQENADMKAKAAQAEADKAKAVDPLAGLDPAARAIVDAERKKAADAQAEAAALLAQARARQFSDKAAEFKHLPMTAASEALLMEVADRLTPESRAEVERLLKAGDEAGRLAKVLEEKGAPGATGASAYERATAMAEQMVKDGKEPSFAKGLSRAWQENPGMYQEYLSERRSERASAKH